MWTILFFVFLFHIGVSVKVRLLVPKYVRSGSAVALVCQYDLEGDDVPYSVKWYRGQYEFFRYLPKSLPNMQAFPLTGINVDISGSNAHQVTLLGVEKQISGPVSCEVSTEGTFRTSADYANLTVIDEPQRRPILLLSSHELRPGFPLEVNCSIPKTTPSPSINFYIGAKKVDSHYITRLTPELASFSITLPTHLDRDEYKSMFFFRCEAALDGAYSLSSANVPVFMSPLPDEISSGTKLAVSFIYAFLTVSLQAL